MKVVSGRELVRILQGRGWVVDRIRGSHYALSCETLARDKTRKVVVPVHGNRDLRTGLQARLMKDAGITEEDL